MYCVYITYYKGNKLPQKYIGSSSIEKIKNGYRGSVSSLEYKETWESEIKNNPTLFETKIISKHRTRKKALEKELEIQKQYNVVESTEWINKSYAQPNGFFGMDVSKEKNPMYGRIRKGETHKGGENISKALRDFFNDSEKSKNHRKKSKERWENNNPSKNPAILKKIKESWKKNNRNIGEKNGMYGKQHPMKNKKLYNNGTITKAFEENKQPKGWILGRHTA